MSRAAALVAGLAAGTLLVACRSTFPAPESTFWRWSAHINGIGVVDGRPECPHSWAEYAQTKYVPALYSGAFSTGTLLSDPITDIPEFHDCQQFIKTDGTYGPLVAIFAAFKLDTMARQIDSLVAKTGTPTFLSVALIFDYYGDAYPQLGVRPGFNCLQLEVSATVMKAHVIPVEADPGRCLSPLTGGTELAVKRRTIPKELPPVARWDWDAIDTVQTIGIKCGMNSWCDIGPSGFTPSAASLMTTDASLDDGQQRVRSGKGWYDEQYLDVMRVLPGATTGTLTPTTITGTVFPHPDLKTYDWDHTYLPRKWVPTAYIAMSAKSGYYRDKFGLEMTPPGAAFAQLNTLELCYGTRGKCGITRPEMLPANTCGVDNWKWSETFPRWWARFQAPSKKGTSEYVYKCVIRRSHLHDGEPLGVPGTARWRWLARDPTIWEECTQGCCEVEVGFE